MMALRLNPDAIFLLSDGEFNGRDKNAHRIRRNLPIEALIDAERKTAIPIHTIAFVRFGLDHRFQGKRLEHWC